MPAANASSPVAQAFFAFIRDQRAQVSALAARFGGSPPKPAAQ